MTDQSGGGSSGIGAAMASGSGGGLIMREYRKGNWTLQETMILIEAKKMDEERRLKRSSAGSTEQQQFQLTTAGQGSSGGLEMRNKPAELRWKWVEDYCWRRGCFRSQNQCNDKWDNLMRDYKKVRDHQRKLLQSDQPQTSSSSSLSYWNMDKTERKERGLPSNMLPTIYDALFQVVERKSSAPANTTDVVMSAVHPVIMQPQPAAALSLLHQQHINASAAAAAAALPLPMPPPPAAAAQPISMYQPVPIPDHGLDSDTSSDSPAKRRRKDKGPETGAGPSLPSSSSAIASAISEGTSRIAEAIQASDDLQEQRHREMVGLSQRRLEIEESRMSGLVEAINNLSNSIIALAASNNISQQQPPPPQP